MFDYICEACGKTYSGEKRLECICGFQLTPADQYQEYPREYRLNIQEITEVQLPGNVKTKKNVVILSSGEVREAIRLFIKKYGYSSRNVRFNFAFTTTGSPQLGIPYHESPYLSYAQAEVYEDDSDE